MVSVPTVLLLLVSGYQVLNYQQKITKKAQADISVTSTNVIAADGYLEPKGEVISVSLPFGMERAR
ncbi:MAG: HlyD family secretion protein, partial [Dolichospermum sp.]